MNPHIHGVTSPTYTCTWALCGGMHPQAHEAYVCPYTNVLDPHTQVLPRMGLRNKWMHPHGDASACTEGFGGNGGAISYQVYRDVHEYANTAGRTHAFFAPTPNN